MLPARCGRSAANLPHDAAAVEWRDNKRTGGQTDTRPLRRPTPHTEGAVSKTTNTLWILRLCALCICIIFFAFHRANSCIFHLWQPLLHFPHLQFQSTPNTTQQAIFIWYLTKTNVIRSLPLRFVITWRRFAPRTAVTDVRSRLLFYGVHSLVTIMNYNAAIRNIAYTAMFHVLPAWKHRRHTLRHVYVTKYVKIEN